MKELTKKCDSCGGTGSNTGEKPGNGEPFPYEIQCQKCEGGGNISIGELSDNLIDFLNDMNNKINDIFEKVSG